MKLLLKSDLVKLQANVQARDKAGIKPVVKFFGGAACTWLISEYDQETDCFFGLCDLGLGEPELGYVAREELFSIRFPPFNLPVERDRHFRANKTLMEYATEARIKRRIMA